MNWLAIVAFVLFVVGAVLAFLVPTTPHNIEMGVLFSGLATWVASTVFPAPRA